ncbi:hypothetical protein Bbelb_047590 [Branchiostoma belcheri]|nr:hypothetical protein Bbelb_047590 [Branchiostoma belcheri]
MKIATVGLLCACVLVTLVYLDGVSGRRFGGGGGFRGGGGGSSSRRRRSTASGFEREQCQRCTTSYIYQNRGYFMVQRDVRLSGAHEVSICREGTAACNWGKCSINYLWANNTITAFPDGKGGEDPAVGYISAQVESVLICGTLQLAPKLQVTILAVAMATFLLKFATFCDTSPACAEDLDSDVVKEESLYYYYRYRARTPDDTCPILSCFDTTMKKFAVGLLCVCLLIALVHVQEASGFFRSRGFRTIRYRTSYSSGAVGHAPALEVTLLAVAVAGVMRMVGGD